MPGDYEFAGSRGRVAGNAFLMLLDIIGSNASRQTTREISYRLVAALALLVTAYSWNASASVDSERNERVASAIHANRAFVLGYCEAHRANAPRKQLMRPLITPGRVSYVK